MWMAQIQQLLTAYNQAIFQGGRYCSTTLDNYQYLFRKMERFGLDDDPLAVPEASCMLLQAACNNGQA